MKITTFILMIGLLQVTAATRAQITINTKQESLRNVLKAISKQSGYDFIYSVQDLNDLKANNLKLNNVSIEEALRATLDNQPLIYEVSDKTVMVKRKEVKEFSIVEKIKEYFATVNVRGRVVDEKFQPLQGATVSVKNGKGSVNTDANGFFYLKNVDENAIVVFTFIGFTKKEIQVEGKEDFGDVRLEMSSNKLDEVQVQFSGITSRRTSTSNIATIKADEIAKQPVDNPLYALMGRVPGLVITPVSGLPNAQVKVQLRGQNGLNSESEPLFVIDGVPTVNNISPNANGSSLQFGLDRDGNYNSQISNLSFINPNDIESINVLKDADATAIYGSRGANGVILITTKRGKVGETTVNAGFYTGFSNVSKKLDMMNTDQYLQMRREVYVNGRQPVPDQNIPGSEKTVANFDLTVWDPNRYTDWQQVFLGGTAMSYNTNANISGGNSTVQYTLGGTFSKLGYVFPGDSKNVMGSGHLTISGNSSNQKFRTSFTSSYSSTTGKAPTDFSSLALQLAPNAPTLYNANGELNWEPNPGSTTGEATWENPMASLLRSLESKSNNLFTGFNLSYSFNSSLTFRTTGGFTQSRFESFSPTPIASQDPSTFSYARGTTFTASSTTDSWSIEPQANFNKSLFGGKLDILLGGSWQGQNLSSDYLARTGFISDALLHSTIAGTVAGQRNTSSQYKYIGAFGRVNYNWKDRYIVNLNVRRDGSSRFGPGNQFGNFGSVGAAWVFTNDPLLLDKKDIVSFGKLRFSYGTSGNDAIGDYQYLELFGSLADAYADIRYQGLPIISPGGATNPDYHWENKRSYEIGTDLGFFKDRILLSTSYFYAISSDALITYPTPYTAGALSGLKVNQSAKLRNSGLEFNLTSENIKSKRFSWTTSANISLFKRNKILDLPNGNYAILRLGLLYPPGVDPVGKPFAGIVAGPKYMGVDPLTGQYSFVGKDGNVTTNFADVNNYATIININPQYYGGISNQFTYGNLSLSFFIQFTKQLGKSFYYQQGWQSSGYSSFGNLPVAFDNRWRTPGDLATFQLASGPVVGNENRLLMSSSDASWIDASFMRLKNVALAYQLPELIRRKLGVKSLSVNINAQNLFTITGYKGPDPETQSVAALPPLRVITTGVQVGF